MALKQISTSQVEMGMFIHSFRGSWLSHPFWRARFLVTDESRLEAVRGSTLHGVVIDTDRGNDVPGSEEAPPYATIARPAIRPPSRRIVSPDADARAPAAARTPAGPITLAREFGNARRVAGQARQVISKVFFEARLGKAPRVAEVAPVVEDIHASIERNPHAFTGLMRCKTEMEAIYQHMLSVSALMITLARQMKLSRKETRQAGMAGMLLDIGLSRLEIDTTLHSGGFESVDPALWHSHCDVGHDLLAAAREAPKPVLHAVLHHHEHMDGTGFPGNLAGRQIDLLSRMAAICDRFDLLVSGAATGQEIDPADAMRMMMQTERAFDSEILGQFQEALGLYPVGSFVTLRSERIAMVVDQHPSDPLLPTVRAFYSLASRAPIEPKTIALAKRCGVDAISGAADLEGLDLPARAQLRLQLFDGAHAAA